MAFDCRAVVHLRQMLSAIIAERRQAFRSSGEYNFMVENADSAIARVIDRFKKVRRLMIPMASAWLLTIGALNLRKSNTEPVVRLNVEARSSAVDIDKKVLEISGLLTSG